MPNAPQTQLDPQVVNLAKAIRSIESNDNPTARGASGEFGYYQFMPDTWASSSQKYLGRVVPLDQASKEEQNEVAYKQLKEWKDQGYNVGQIASMWNAGSGRPNAYVEGNAGVNAQGVQYDTSAYAKKVAERYQALKTGGGQQTAGPAPVPVPGAQPQAPQTPQYNVPGIPPPPHAMGSEAETAAPVAPEQKVPIANRIANFLGFEKTVDTLGNLIARAGATEDEKQYIEKPTAKEAAGAALNVGSIFIGGGAAGQGAKLIGKGALRQAIGRGAAGGALAGGTTGVASGLEENKDAAGIAKSGLVGAGVGTGLGAAFPIAGAAAGLIPVAGRLGKRVVGGAIEGAESAVARQAQLRAMPSADRAALQAGLPDQLVDFVRTTNPETQKSFAKMLDIHKKGLANLAYADKNKVKQVPAQTFLKYVEGIQQSSRKAGQQLSQIAKSEPGVQRDYSPVLQEFVDRLEAKGIRLNPKTGSFESTGRIPTAEMKYYDDMLREIQRVTNDSPYLTNEQAHQLRQRLFATLDSATRQGGQVGTRPYSVDVDADVQFLRSKIADEIGGEYKDLAQTYAMNEAVLRDVAKIAGTTIDEISTKDLKLGEVLMRTLGNAADRPQSLIDDVLAAAERNGIQVDKDINAQLRFADLVERLYGSTQTRTLAGQVKQGVSESAAEMIPDIATGNLTGMVLKLGRNLMGKGEKEQIKAFEQLINEYAGRGGGLIQR